jgi:Schlafen, AlbA_2
MDLTETFNGLNLAEIDDYLKRGQEEHLQLDFKTIKSASLSSADDRRTLAKSISGFANSAGGIIVWGIVARQNDQGIDCAVSASEIKQLKLLLSRLNEFTGQATSPIVDGVRSKLIERTDDCGFATTLVPESQSGPHMAKLTEDRYYKRSGASFYKMEHFDLEDMFGRRQKPNLQLMLEVARSEDKVFEITVRLINSGRAVARHSGLLLRLDNAEIKESGQFENLSAINAGRPVLQYTNDHGVIHPNAIRLNVGTVNVQRLDDAKPISLHATIYCEDMRAAEHRIEVHGVSSEILVV